MNLSYGILDCAWIVLHDEKLMICHSPPSLLPPSPQGVTVELFDLFFVFFSSLKECKGFYHNVFNSSTPGQVGRNGFWKPIYDYFWAFVFSFQVMAQNSISLPDHEWYWNSWGSFQCMILLVENRIVGSSFGKFFKMHRYYFVVL